MKRAIVIGCPGSGKSTFATALARITGLPLYHLDMMYWRADRTTVPREVFLRALGDALAGEEWIIDGNYLSTLEQRMSACDTVIFLDYPLEVCLRGIAERRGKPRADMPWVELEEDREFTEFIRNFERDTRPAVLSLIEKHHEKRILVFRSREDADAFLREEFLDL